ncbi:MAG TPA: hypothetical protein PLM60_05085 [Methanoregulaceae archaeon]|jgi:membrane protease YdiL (CAAX protease family)|nr:CPBP family intramembrane metalloprotease [Burkholderiaceae bacterium]NLH25822.1 CPBP family intramembrane metalloprotease [Methanomicrobiales archaeon]HNL85837.1 hypothetical protein [Methanoregulaceae archaeon]HNO07635.1 hypothetical protein [Methanoregulaceae archaeon]HNW80880.1 hypothetical protein [Methanoregulaceae archaeon]
MSETLQRERDSDSCRILVLASLTYLVWVIVTYLLEGRILTLLRPEAVIDRTAYTLIANILIGIILALLVIRKAERTRLISLESAGFRPLKRTIIAVIIAFLGGLAILLIQHHGAPNLVVLLNVYAQVLTVTIAEIVICWGMIGSITEGTLSKKGRIIAIAGGILIASVLFGLYHIGHSPPFNQAGMILLLSFIGIVTSLVYFVGRDIYATIAFHNFLGCIGVIQALEAAGSLPLYEKPLLPVLGMAAISVAVFITIDFRFIRQGSQHA